MDASLTGTAPRRGTADRTTSHSLASVATWGLMFFAGFWATNAFDFWGQVVSPFLGFANLSPHGLAKSLFGVLGLPNGDFAGYFMHFYLVGLVGYPVGWLFIFKPLWNAVVGDRLGWFVPAAIYGFALWVFAIGGITLIAGLPFFSELHRHHLGRLGRARPLRHRPRRRAPAGDAPNRLTGSVDQPDQ